MMTLDQLRNFCLALPNVTEDFPFDEEHIVFKVYEKMFALTSVVNFTSINLKCEPAFAIILREKYIEVKPGFHMNKKHWNTIDLQGNIADKLLQEWITNSYYLVLAKVPKKMK